MPDVDVLTFEGVDLDSLDVGTQTRSPAECVAQFFI